MSPHDYLKIKPVSQFCHLDDHHNFQSVFFLSFTYDFFFFYIFSLCFRPAPRLKDANLPESKAREVYLDTILMVRRLYHECRLIHGDLSEFNML